MLSHHLTAITLYLQTELLVIKSFPQFYINSSESHNLPNYGYASILLLPFFPLSHYSYNNTNQKSIHRSLQHNALGDSP